MKRIRLLGGVLLAVAVAVPPAHPASAAPAMTARVQAESAKANAFFDRVFDEEVARSPMRAAFLGLKTNNDQWDDFSEARRAEDLALTVQHLAELRRTIRFDDLDEQTSLSYRLFVFQADRAIEAWRWRNHAYTFTQMEGLHSTLPAFLINFHTIDTVADAEAYLARLRSVPRVFAQLSAHARDQEAQGILPPKFVFPLLTEACTEVITGAPFQASAQPSALLQDFQAKLAALRDADASTKDRLLRAASGILRDEVKPAYEKLIAMFAAQEKVAVPDDGVWKLPDGDAYYEFELRQHTTARFSAAEVHDMGRREVARIHAEMNAIKDRVGFQGDLPAFLAFMRDDPQFSYPTTPAGKSAYVARATEMIERMRARLPEFFGTQPKAGLVVKLVEPFREKGSAGAFYEQPSADGSRPGAYYINTIDMRGLPIWEMETLAHHEAIPGHHMQNAIAQELENMPKIRRFADFNAYGEGWALYAEYFPKEFGFYQDPYQDFGRLSDELLRAVRLVVDTGIHAKRWTRQQVVDYMRANTAGSERDNFTESNRYVVWPGQACSYKIGMIKILELRERARRELGTRFDLRAFHDAVLMNGPLPLDLLEDNVRNWIERQKR